eukprot:4498043-Pleurochrysis_carterae.AAC.3
MIDDSTHPPSPYDELKCACEVGTWRVSHKHTKNLAALGVRATCTPIARPAAPVLQSLYARVG